MIVLLKRDDPEIKYDDETITEAMDTGRETWRLLRGSYAYSCSVSTLRFGFIAPRALRAWKKYHSDRGITPPNLEECSDEIMECSNGVLKRRFRANSSKNEHQLQSLQQLHILHNVESLRQNLTSFHIRLCDDFSKHIMHCENDNFEFRFSGADVCDFTQQALSDSRSDKLNAQIQNLLSTKAVEEAEAIVEEYLNDQNDDSSFDLQREVVVEIERELQQQQHLQEVAELEKQIPGRNGRLHARDDEKEPGGGSFFGIIPAISEIKIDTGNRIDASGVDLAEQKSGRDRGNSSEAISVASGVDLAVAEQDGDREDGREAISVANGVDLAVAAEQESGREAISVANGVDLAVAADAEQESGREAISDASGVDLAVAGHNSGRGINPVGDDDKKDDSAAVAGNGRGRGKRGRGRGRGAKGRGRGKAGKRGRGKGKGKGRGRGAKGRGRGKRGGKRSGKRSKPIPRVPY